MPGEIIANLGLEGAVHGMAHGAQYAGNYGLAHSKAVLAGAGTLILGGATLAAKKHAAGGDTKRSGRVKRVEQGELGLREHNNRFYKSKPIRVNGEVAGWKKNFFVKGEVVGQEKVFFELMEPGLRIAPVPWFKYKLINTQNDPVDLDFKDKRVVSKDERMFDLSGGIVWGHILGFDEHRQRIPYEYTDGRGSVSVEQLVFNGIMAAKSQTEVGRQITSLIEPAVWGKLYGTADPVGESRGLFDTVKQETHNALLDLGAELRALNLTVSPNVLDHYGHIGRTSLPSPTELGQSSGEHGPFGEDLVAIEQALPGAVPGLHIVHGES